MLSWTSIWLLRKSKRSFSRFTLSWTVLLAKLRGPQESERLDTSLGQFSWSRAIEHCPMRSNPNGLQTIAFLIYEVAWNSVSLGVAQAEVAKIHHHKTLDKIKTERASNVMYVEVLWAALCSQCFLWLLTCPFYRWEHRLEKCYNFPRADSSQMGRTRILRCFNVTTPPKPLINTLS